MSEENTTTTETITETTETTAESEPKSFLDTLPESYRDKPYLKDINDMDSLLKSFDNSQQLIGKKRELNLPTEKSTPEEWDKYYEAIGRPSKAEEYKLNYSDDIKDIINSESLENFKKVAHEQGITEKQAQSLLDYETQLYKNLVDQYNEEQAESDKQFKEITTKYFGADKEKIMQTGEDLIKKYLPEGLEEHFTKLDNNSKVIMASVLNGLKKDYMSEDSLTNISKGGNKPTAEDKLSEARKLMMSPEYKNVMHPEHDKIKKYVDGVYKELYSS